MEEKLLDVITRRLLAKFGQGSHKPGSGSAAALTGLLSAELLRTVIELTLDKRRAKNYSNVAENLRNITAEINGSLYSRLETLFQEDSNQFDVVIQLRKKRDHSKQDPIKYAELSLQTKIALKKAIEIPIEIANICLKLGEHATYVFNNGFKSARGDSSVAISNAISAIASCLSIIELNLQLCEYDNWLIEIRKVKTAIKDWLNQLRSKADQCFRVLEREAEEHFQLRHSFHQFLTGNLSNHVNSNADLERFARILQNNLWACRNKIWGNIDIDPLDILDPEVVIKKILGYHYVPSESLGMFELDGELFEVAGMIDKSKKLIQTSAFLPTKILNFTLAHELGHAIFHNQRIMHRDRPLDGAFGKPKTLQEMQADKFAAYFLMPKSLVEKYFEAYYHTKQFYINDETSFNLRSSVKALRESCKSRRDIGRILASAEYYAGNSFMSLSDLFRVSEEAMAIRLEELGLI